MYITSSVYDASCLPCGFPLGRRTPVGATSQHDLWWPAHCCKQDTVKVFGLGELGVFPGFLCSLSGLPSSPKMNRLAQDRNLSVILDAMFFLSSRIKQITQSLDCPVDGSLESWPLPATTIVYTPIFFCKDSHLFSFFSPFFPPQCHIPFPLPWPLYIPGSTRLPQWAF